MQENTVTIAKTYLIMKFPPHKLSIRKWRAIYTIQHVTRGRLALDAHRTITDSSPGLLA
jgi:hypothetical protein